MFEKLFEAFRKEGEELFFVGGFVRDFLSISDEPNFWADVRDGKKDVDFATSANPEKIKEILNRQKLQVVPIGIEFGTIQTFVDDVQVEITTFRCSESYTKGSRRPNVVFGKSLKEDLLRRDFTVNAIAMNSDFKVVDPLNGLEDLLRKRLRTPIHPEISFNDDPLRMLRACRFAARGFKIGHHEFDALKFLAKDVLSVSGERIFEELTKLLLLEDPSDGLQLMHDTGLMMFTIPDVCGLVEFQKKQGKESKALWDHTLEVIRNSPPRPEVRWAALFHDISKPETFLEKDGKITFRNHELSGAARWTIFASGLKASKDFKDKVHFLIHEHLRPGVLAKADPTDSALRNFLRSKVGDIYVGENLDDLFDLSIADFSSKNEVLKAQKIEKTKALKQRLQKLIEDDGVMKLKLPKGLGNKLYEELKIQPGPNMGKIMKVLESKLIAGELTLESDFVEEARKWITQETH